MGCCRIPDLVGEKINGVMKELHLKKFSKLLRVAAELSWNGWNENATIEKLYPEYNSVEKQSRKTRLYLEKTAESLTRELKGLDYNFPPKEKFCSEHMWFAGETSYRQAGKQILEQNRTGDQHKHCNPVAGQDGTEAPALPASWYINPVVRYETHDADVTAKFLAFLTSTDMDWSVLSDTFRDLVVHALELRASRLSAFYMERCARIGRRMDHMKPVPESSEHTLQEDSAALNNILAKFEPSYENLMDIFHRHMTLSEKLFSCPEHLSDVTCIPITVRWNVPASLPPITRNEWINFQSRMRAWMIQIRQDPDSFETVKLLERILEIVKQESSIVLDHPGVHDWLDGVRRLAKSVRSRNGSKLEVEGIVHQLRDYDRRSREALVEIKSKLAEFSECDHQVGILQERSQARLNAMIVKSQELITVQPDNLLNSIDAKGETDMVQEYTFGVTKCLPPWTFPQVVSLLQPIVVNLAWFVRQGYGNGNLDHLLRENIDRDIRLLAGMVCNSRVFELSAATTVETQGGESLSCRPPVSSNATGDNDTAAPHESKRQRRD